MSDHAAGEPGALDALAVEPAAPPPEELGQVISLREANHIVKTSVIAAMGAAWVPVPVADLLILSGICMVTIRRLCAFYEIPFDHHVARGAVLVLAAGAGPLLVTSGFASVAKFLPGVSELFGGAAGSISAGAFTYAVGQVFITHFEQGGTLETFRATDHLTFFRRAIKTHKA